ncbi:Probable methyltransferase At1g29790 [Linum perenne]
MTYDVGGTCPSDDVFAQRLMLKGCEPLPRRRCHPRKAPGFYDCKDCFDLRGRERSRWMVDRGGLDFGINEVLAAKPPGTIRIGMDIGGGSGTFAARMSERNITIITSTMNLDGPFNSFIASRGLIPIHYTVTQRLPFFENTLDIVHSMHILSNWIPDTMLEFTLYDIHRVLRPGGLFWLDHFFCLGNQLNATYIPMLDRVGFKKLRWHAGMKLDRGADKNEWYFSALLEKPVT